MVLELLIASAGEGAMHYHVVLIDSDHRQRTETFETWDEAEKHAATMSKRRDDWRPRRQRGRSWRRGEIAVYLDHRAPGRHVTRREIAIIRCNVTGREPQLGCFLWGLMPEPTSSA